MSLASVLCRQWISRAALASPLANHGPVVCGKDIDAAVYAMEELEEAAKPTLLCRGLSPALLTKEQVSDLAQKFDVSW